MDFKVTGYPLPAAANVRDMFVAAAHNRAYGLRTLSSLSEVCTSPFGGTKDCMSRILTRRNAVLSWLAWKAGQPTASRRAKRDRTTLLLVPTGSVAALALGATSIVRR